MTRVSARSRLGSLGGAVSRGYALYFVPSANVHHNQLNVGGRFPVCVLGGILLAKTHKLVGNYEIANCYCHIDSVRLCPREYRSHATCLIERRCGDFPPRRSDRNES